MPWTRRAASMSSSTSIVGSLAQSRMVRPTPVTGSPRTVPQIARWRSDDRCTTMPPLRGPPPAWDGHLVACRERQQIPEPGCRTVGEQRAGPDGQHGGEQPDLGRDRRTRQAVDAPGGRQQVAPMDRGLDGRTGNAPVDQLATGDQAQLALGDGRGDFVQEHGFLRSDCSGEAAVDGSPGVGRSAPLRARSRFRERPPRPAQGNGARNPGRRVRERQPFPALGNRARNPRAATNRRRIAAQRPATDCASQAAWKRASLSGFSTPRMLATRPSRNEGTSTSSGRPPTVTYQPSCPFTRTGSTWVPGSIRDARLMSSRATRSAPTTGRRAADGWRPRRRRGRRRR